MKQILVTGASSGIGRAIAESLVDQNTVVWAGARNPAVLADLAKKHHGHFRPVKLDVTSDDDIAFTMRTIAEERAIDSFSLINNAGVAVGGPFECIPVREYKSVFDVNLFGLIEMTQAALPLLRKTKGRIVNIGSVSGRISAPFMSPYTGSKFAVRAVTDSLRREMMAFGVEVSLIEPGPIDTGIWSKSIERSQALKAEMSPAQFSVYENAISSLVKGVEATAKHAISTDAVVGKVKHALYSKRPRAYYLVGKNTGLIGFLTTFVPTRILDKMLNSSFRFTIGE